MVNEVNPRLNCDAHSLLQHTCCPQRLQTWLIDTLHSLGKGWDITSITTSKSLDLAVLSLSLSLSPLLSLPLSFSLSFSLSLSPSVSPSLPPCPSLPPFPSLPPSHPLLTSGYPPTSCTSSPMKCPRPWGMNTAPRRTSIILSTSPHTSPAFFSSSSSTRSARRCMSAQHTPKEWMQCYPTPTPTHTHKQTHTPTPTPSSPVAHLH